MKHLTNKEIQSVNGGSNHTAHPSLYDTVTEAALRGAIHGAAKVAPYSFVVCGFCTIYQEYSQAIKASIFIEGYGMIFGALTYVDRALS